MFCYSSHSLRSLPAAFLKNRHLFALYVVPAFFYSILSSLVFADLTSLTPQTYMMLLQLAIPMVASLFQVSCIEQVNFFIFLYLRIKIHSKILQSDIVNVAK